MNYEASRGEARAEFEWLRDQLTTRFVRNGGKPDRAWKPWSSGAMFLGANFTSSDDYQYEYDLDGDPDVVRITWTPHDPRLTDPRKLFYTLNLRTGRGNITESWDFRPWLIGAAVLFVVAGAVVTWRIRRRLTREETEKIERHRRNIAEMQRRRIARIMAV